MPAFWQILTRILCHFRRGKPDAVCRDYLKILPTIRLFSGFHNLSSESVQEIISDNEIDSLVSDPDKVVDIIMYVKNEAAKQDISDDQIRSLIQTAESTAGVSLSEEEENRIIKIVKQIKDSDIDEEQLRSAVTKAYDKLEEMGIGKEEVKGILHKLADFAKSLFE